MGFSVSGAAAIIFASLLVAFGMWFTASAESFERVTDAQNDRSSDVLEQANAAVTIANATHDNDTDQLTIVVDNEGATTHRLAETDLLIDGRYVTGWQADNASVAGDPDTDLWSGAERLRITLSLVEPPTRVKVIANPGVADSATVIDL